MFRDPEFFKEMRSKVIPALRTYPFIRIWHAGCSTGEEVYSMAIVLMEEDLLHKAKIYATDFNEHVLQMAKKGIIPLDNMREYTEKYQLSGGNRAFSSYYTACYDHARMNRDIFEKITFARHNLAMESSFNEFNVIICRNVLIYFSKDLQEKVYELFDKSLCRFGYLGLGGGETLKFTGFEGSFSLISEGQQIYRRNH